ncbi:MAG TPA: DUF11 domain-containing protein [Thermoanaerobaculia bacterium]|nr:DUF11 domain-containing protein [Thermoanaerobaculia bacterium]
MTDRSSALRLLANDSVGRAADVAVTPDARRAANQTKKSAKRAHHHGSLQPGTLSFRPRPLATGSIQLIDAAGLKYFIDTNINFSTSSSASGAASEASFSAPVVASTIGGGSVLSALSDMFDGYQGLCVSLTNATGPCATGNASYSFYNQNGAAAFDATVPAGPTCTNRQVALPAKTIGGLSVRRKVFVPTNDQFIRWMDIFTNTSGAPVTFTTMPSNNLGSDSNTIIVSSSNGDNVAQTSDTWVSTFQNFSGTTSSDPRIGHVLQGVGAPTPVSNIHFVNGDDNPYWVYSITLAPGQTKIILNFATGQGTKAAANAKAAALALLPSNATQCMSLIELGQVSNFVTATDLSITKNTAAPVAVGGNPITYTLAVSNVGNSPANTVSVSDTLPAGSSFVSASGIGWTCNNAAGVVTCTVATLPVGAAPVINLTINAPAVSSPGTLSNTATVSSAGADSNLSNNSSTATVPIQPSTNVPAFGAWTLMLLATMLSIVALARRT